MKTYDINIWGKEDYKELGNSRIGGIPDLPEDIEFPTHPKYELQFFAQINFKEFPEIENSILPKEGIVYLFIQKEYFGEYKLIYVKEPKNLIRKKIISKEEVGESRKINFTISNDSDDKRRLGTVLKRTHLDDNETYLILNDYEPINDNILFLPEGPVYFHPEGKNPFSKNVEDLIERDKNGNLIGNEEEIIRQKLLLKFDEELEYHRLNYSNLICLFSFGDIKECSFYWHSYAMFQIFIMKEDLINLNFNKEKITNHAT